MTQNKQLSPAEKLAASFKRSKKFSNARVKNINYYKQAKVLYADSSEDEYGYPQLARYCKCLQQCGGLSLYRTRKAGRQSTFITGLTCDHRLCNICNMIRSRKLRRKWMNFLTDETKDILIRKKQCHMFGIDYGKYDPDEAPRYTSGVDIVQRFDFMHLTLTFPHAKGVWNNREYYAAELLSKFNQMRKASWWKDIVFGGEYTIETTLGKNGLHIHIHALLLTDKKVMGSRNYLHEKILRTWNKLTVNYSDERPAKITDTIRAAAIKSALKTWTVDFDKRILPKLDARGATMIGLQSLYHEVPYSQYQKYKKGRFEKDGKYFHYCKSGNTGSMLKGVVECLKYHFEPCSLELPDTDGQLNEPLLKAVLSNIYRQRLYGKFGGFYGVSKLNVLETPVALQDLIAELKETGEEIFDPATGGSIDVGEFDYRIVDARFVAYDDEKKHTLVSKSKTRVVIGSEQATTTRDAIRVLTEIGIPKQRS